MNTEASQGGLSDLELVHLRRMLRRERLFKVFSVAHILVGAGLAGTFSWAGTWNGTRAVLLVLILLGARAHLRQLRSARLLRKTRLPAANPPVADIDSGGSL